MTDCTYLQCGDEELRHLSEAPSLNSDVQSVSDGVSRRVKMRLDIRRSRSQG